MPICAPLDRTHEPINANETITDMKDIVLLDLFSGKLGDLFK